MATEDYFEQAPETDFGELNCTSEKKPSSKEEINPRPLRVDLKKDLETGEMLSVFIEVPLEHSECIKFLGALIEVHWRLVISESEEDRKKAQDLESEIQILVSKYSRSTADTKTG